MIRKLASGEYRLYSRKIPRRGSDAIWARSKHWPPRKNMSATSSISNVIE
jgi:hypothetical protein